jgi:hypothetical protein
LRIGLLTAGHPLKPKGKHLGVSPKGLLHLTGCRNGPRYPDSSEGASLSKIDLIAAVAELYLKNAGKIPILVLEGPKPIRVYSIDLKLAASDLKTLILLVETMGESPQLGTLGLSTSQILKFLQDRREGSPLLRKTTPPEPGGA